MLNDEHKGHINDKLLDSVRGCMLGGAIGDALGYPVEFCDENTIINNYGDKGITEYKINKLSKKAVISDDTQMSLFTANGLLYGDAKQFIDGRQTEPWYYVEKAYLDWYYTQWNDYEDKENIPEEYPNGFYSWLMDVPEMYARRAPGNTCLKSLQKQLSNNPYDGNLFNQPRNTSKGSGGIMRIAPYGILAKENFDFKNAAKIAAITHGHSLGYMPAAVLAYITNRVIYDSKSINLKEIVYDSITVLDESFPNDENLEEMHNKINLAISLSEELNADDIANIHKIGEGWVAEETLGISLYCALKYQNDFSKAVITAVNHKGDSDSTGAVTGNIVGALVGYEAIENKWKKDLELNDVIQEIAEDMYYAIIMDRDCLYHNKAWERKYVYAQWK